MKNLSLRISTLIMQDSAEYMYYTCLVALDPLLHVRLEDGEPLVLPALGPVLRQEPRALLPL